MSAYRVFVSYSHEDIETAKKVVQAIEAAGLTAMWDRSFSSGQGFPDQIKTFITYSHVFLPVITEASSRRGWVHEEVGYATALSIPILPVMLGTLPSEMIRELQGIELDCGDADWQHRLPRRVFDNLLSSHRDVMVAPYLCAEFHEERTNMMAKYANDVLNLEAKLKMSPSGMIRQKGGLSSFHIPDKVTTHSIWRQRYGTVDKSDFHRRLQREERLALEKHARQSGCRIIVDPSITFDEFGPEARLARLQTLLEFLDGMPDDRVWVAFSQEMDREESITIVGDWFAAAAVSRAARQGYRQTIFTRHAPSMQTRIDLFDDEFSELLEQSGWKAESSREAAIAEIETIVADLKSKLDGKKKPTV